MRKSYQLIFLFLISSAPLFAQQKVSMQQLISEKFSLADEQYKVLMNHTPRDRMPRSYDPITDAWITSDTKWWCSGFYAGSLLYIYEYTKDTVLLNEAVRRLALLKGDMHYTGTHDLGFMMFCSFGNAYRLTHNLSYKRIIDTAALSLSSRFRPKIGAIQSWDSNKNFVCPVIIDNMMNLELLCWDGEYNGRPRLIKMAESHADVTMTNHFRKDFSSYHVVDYNPRTGKVLKKGTFQGANDSSAWSRGQAWGLYGYSMMYGYTKEIRYLQQAEHIAHFILTNPNMPKDMVPYWDFNAPGIPNAFRDASAAAIMASAFLELGQYVPSKEQKIYVQAAARMIRSLSSLQYFARLGQNGGYLLMHSVGALPFHKEVDVPLTYADYYYLEALLRYQKWYLKKYNY